MRNDLNDYEENERQNARMEAIEGKGDREVSVSEPTSLIAAYSGDTNLDVEDYESLMRKSHIPTISLYLSFTPDKLLRDRKIYLTVFNSLRNQTLAETHEFCEQLTHHQRKQLEQDFDDIHTFLEHYFNPENGRALVIFKSGLKLNKILLLPFHIPDQLAIDRTSYLSPLQQILQTEEKILTVTIEKEEATIERFLMGKLYEVDTISSFVPSEQVDKSIPKKAQRHREQHLNWHFTAVAKKVEEIFRENKDDRLVLFGSDEQMLHGLQSQFSKLLRDKTLETMVLAPETTTTEKVDLLQELLNHLKSKIEEEAIGNIGKFQAESMVVAGLPHVIEAQNRSFVRKLYISDDLRSPGFICKRDNYLSLTEGNCPLCGQAMRLSTNIVDELVELAQAQKAELLLVDKKKDALKPFQGIVGVTYKL